MKNVVKIPPPKVYSPRLDAQTIIKYCKSGVFTDEELLDCVEMFLNHANMHGRAAILRDLNV